jgi:hypothetical protein
MMSLYLQMLLGREIYGLGVVIPMEQLETIQQFLDPLQSQYFQEEITGNPLLMVVGMYLA